MLIPDEDALARSGDAKDAARIAPPTHARPAREPAGQIPRLAGVGSPRTGRSSTSPWPAMLALVLASAVWGTADVAGKLALGTIPR